MLTQIIDPPANNRCTALHLATGEPNGPGGTGGPDHHPDTVTTAGVKVVPKLTPFIGLAMLCLAASPGFANDQARLAGAWTLLSYEVEQQATGAREPVLGQHPSGSIIFTPEGRMMVVLTAEGRKPPATDQDRAELLTSLVAYTGLYRLDGQKWITTVDASANPAWVGGEQTRFFKFNGDRLQESTGWMAWPAHPEKGAVRFILNWECAQ